MGVKIVETSLRDGHQSLFATRMTTDEVVSVAKELDDAGYYALEVWGGATFDACLRFLNEDPWERLRKVRAVCKKTKLHMLFRGQNILGYRHYSDDVVDKFCNHNAVVKRICQNFSFCCKTSSRHFSSLLHDYNNHRYSAALFVRRQCASTIYISYIHSLAKKHRSELVAALILSIDL